MELPIAIRTQLEESERTFDRLMERLGLDRESLSAVAERIQSTRTTNRPRPTGAAPQGRRTIHV